jgi:hypothetical protein
MSMDNRLAGDIPHQEPDAELQQVLGEFKASVHAWSEAAYNRPRHVQVVRRRSWRLAAGWAMGCVLVAGSLTGGVFERQHSQELARAAAVRHARQQRLAADERMREENAELLATVDSEVSSEVPSAMEPLAQLMDESANQ